MQSLRGDRANGVMAYHYDFNHADGHDHRSYATKLVEAGSATWFAWLVIRGGHQYVTDDS